MSLTDLQTKGYAALPSKELAVLGQLPEERAEFVKGWERLVQDNFMADGGTYRYRRYSRLLLSPGSATLQDLVGTSIYQDLHDNPLNGGVVRTFAPLEPAILENAFLQHLILADAAAVGLSRGENWQVGIHMVRILARSDRPGESAPEGIHIDAERFTVQHLISRHNVKGGVFTAYSSQKTPLFHWLQLEPWDTVFFTGTTWHGATPIEQRDPGREGHRDILLIDFHPLEPSTTA